MNAEQFIALLGSKAKPTKTANGWQCRCPAHDDNKPSLSVTQASDRVLVHCHVNCSPETICAAVGIQLADLFNDKPDKGRIVAQYPYHDASGALLFEVVRFDPKDFRQRKPDSAALGGWTWNTKCVSKVLFRLPETLKAIQSGKFIFVCEGEKDALAMVKHGFSATTNPGGAGKWLDSYTETLRGADCVIIADKDDAGRAHAQLVAGELHGVAKSVRVIELPDTNGKPVKDAADFLNAGGTAETLGQLVDQTEEYDPQASGITGRPIGELALPKPGDETELFDRRWLCSGGGVLLTGKSGQGKSSLAVQLSLEWSLGRVSCGIRPTRPLRVVVVQAENDAGDMAEMFDGVARGLKLSDAERKLCGERVLIYFEDSLAGDNFLQNVVRPLVARHKPDLLVIDPAMAYVQGDVNDAAVVGQFLRRGLNPILHEFKCCCLVIHHTTKAKSEQSQTTADFLYSGSGSAEWSNWARAVLALETKGNGVFRLHCPKRGARLGWADAEGNPTFDRFFRHSKMPGEICWYALDEDEAEDASRVGKSKSDLMALVPLTGNLPKSVLIEKAQATGIGRDKAAAFLDALIEDGALHVWLVKRAGTNPAKHISRLPCPETEANLPQPAI